MCCVIVGYIFVLCYSRLQHSNIVQMYHTTSFTIGDIAHYVGVRYGVATISRLLKTIGLFCKRAL